MRSVRRKFFACARDTALELMLIDRLSTGTFVACPSSASTVVIVTAPMVMEVGMSESRILDWCGMKVKSPPSSVSPWSERGMESTRHTALPMPVAVEAEQMA